MCNKSEHENIANPIKDIGPGETVCILPDIKLTYPIPASGQQVGGDHINTCTHCGCESVRFSKGHMNTVEIRCAKCERGFFGHDKQEAIQWWNHDNPLPETIDPYATHFVCPDGDYHVIRPISAIWLDLRKRWWKSKWIVNLQYEDGEIFCWERDTDSEAKSVRDQLIQIFHRSHYIDHKEES